MRARDRAPAPTPAQRMRAWVMFGVLCLATLGALGALIMSGFQAWDAWPGPRGGRRLRTVQRDEQEAAA